MIQHAGYLAKGLKKELIHFASLPFRSPFIFRVNLFG